VSDSGPRSHERSVMFSVTHHSEGRMQYLLNFESQILQSISAQKPVPQILNEICNALDSEIANVVSLVTLGALESTNAVDAARSAARFGLNVFFSAGIVADNGETLGSLEIYCCYDQCKPSPRELQMIERAACLAAIAVERGMGARPVEPRFPDDGPARPKAFEWPSLN
jgi:hypothetical protein